MALLKPVYITAFDLPDAWYQCLRAVLENGHEYTIERGSFRGHKRRELDFAVVAVTNPSNRPLVPEIPKAIEADVPTPSSMEYVNRYLQYLATPFKEKTEEYTYGERLAGVKADQIEKVIRMYKEEGFGTNQACMEVAMPTDIDLTDPPCLRLVDTRVRYGRLHFIVYFRCINGGQPIVYSSNNYVKRGTMAALYLDFQGGSKVKVLTLSPEGALGWTEVISSTRRKEAGTRILKCANGSSVEVTGTHPMILEDFVVKQAQDVSEGEKLVSCVGKLDALNIDKIDVIALLCDDAKTYLRRVPISVFKRNRKLIKRWWLDRRVLPIALSSLLTPEERSEVVVGYARSPKCFPPTLDITEEFCYFLGLFEAEGSIYRNHIRIPLGVGNSKQRMLLERFLSSLGLRPSIDQRGSCVVYDFSSPLLSGILMKLGFRLGARNKVVPDLIFNLEVSMRLKFVEGWLDGDGGSTSSKELAYGIKDLLNISGVYSSVYHEEGRSSSIEGRIIRSSEEFKVILSDGSRHREGDMVQSRVNSIEMSDGLSEVYDLEVRENGNFIVGYGGICVHNSWDLWAGFPSNLAALQLLKEYMAKQIGVDDGEIIACSKGLHLYDYQFEWAEKRVSKAKPQGK